MFFFTFSAAQIKRALVITAAVLLIAAVFCVTGSCAARRSESNGEDAVSPSAAPFVAVVSVADTAALPSGSAAAIPANVRLDRLIIGDVLARPLDAAVVTSTFGFRDHPISGTYSFHSGLDLAAPEGTEIYAVLSGTVVSAGWLSGYGNCIILDHGDKLNTLYAHCSSFVAAPGEQVEKGGLIAYVGSTGNATGPHLHIEFRLNGQRFDPQSLIGGMYG